MAMRTVLLDGADRQNQERIRRCLADIFGVKLLEIGHFVEL